MGGLLGDAIELGFLPRDVDAPKLQAELQKVYDDAQVAMQDEVRLSYHFSKVVL